MFSRATSSPAATSALTRSGEEDAGPRVQTIFARRLIAGAPLPKLPGIPSGTAPRASSGETPSGLYHYVGLDRLPLTQRPGGRVVEAQVLDLLDGGLPAPGRLREVDRGVVRTRQAVHIDLEFRAGLVGGCPEHKHAAVAGGTVVGEPPARPRR